MKFEKRKIVIDFDDTLVQSSQQIISMLNKKYNLKKSIDDLKDWSYTSIYPKITTKEVFELFSSDEFFENVKLNYGVKYFMSKFKDEFKFVICSKGDEKNLQKKKNFCDKLFKGYDYEFIGLKFFMEEKHSLDKSYIDFSDCIFCIDDNTNALQSINTNKKILIKNDKNFYWNKTPENSSNIYVVNNFYQIAKMCEFDLMLIKEGIFLG